MITKKFSKASLCVIMLLALSATTASAKSWRINNDTRKQANFTDINAAMASADVAAGDTLYLDPGCVLSSKQTITKSVTVVGTGYFLPNGLVGAKINATLYIKAAGAKINAVTITGTVYIENDNITLERCMINKILRSGVTRYGLTVLQCYINCSTDYSSIEGEFRNATIKNNIIRNQFRYDSYAAIYNVHDSEISYNYLVTEGCNKSYISDVIKDITNSQIYNNIIKHGS